MSAARSATGARAVASWCSGRRRSCWRPEGWARLWKVTSNSWEYTGDGHTLGARGRRRPDRHGVVQFHPTGMVWPPSVRGILVTEGVRGDGGMLRNTEGRALHVQLHPRLLPGRDRRHRGRGRPLVPGQRQQPAHARSASRATRSRARSTPRSRPAAAARTAASSSTSRRDATPTTSSGGCPSMYHQFKELADVDITKEPMEVGPDLPLHHGRRPGRRDTAATSVPGLFAAGEVAGGHARREPARRQLALRPARLRPASRSRTPREYAQRVRRRRRGRRRAGRAGGREARSRPSRRTGGENPYAIHADLRTCMQAPRRDHPHRGRAAEGARGARSRSGSALAQGHVSRVTGSTTRAGTSRSTCSRCSPSRRCVARAALERDGEPRRPHARRLTRAPTPSWGKVNVVVRRSATASSSVVTGAAPGRCRPSCESLLRGEVDDGRTRRRPCSVWRGDAAGGAFVEYHVAVRGGRWSSSTSCIASRPPRPPDLAVRWNCKAGKCGSCSAEINGMPRLMCMTRMNTFAPGEPITVAPMQTFPVIKDLVTDVSFNYEMAKTIPAFKPQAEGGRRHAPDVPGGRRPRAGVPQVHRVLPVPGRLPRDPRPRGEQADVRRARASSCSSRRSRCTRSTRTTACELIKQQAGLGFCNITKCCTEVCPEHIHITDNAIIPLKERIVTEYHDPVVWVWRKLTRRR